MTHPDQLEAVRNDRSLLPQAIEEALRFEPPLLTIARTTTCEVEIGGVTLAAGEGITTNIGSANHDETRWDNPEVFDIFRPGHPPHRLRPRPAHVPRHAPGPHRDQHPDEPGLGPPS